MARLTASKPAEEQYLNCIRCGLCLAVCPTYRTRLSETASPRGRVALARKELEGDLGPSANLQEQMYACFGCMACDEICPVGIRPSELAMNMRAWHDRSHHSLSKRLLFEDLIADPLRLELATAPLRLYERLGLRRRLSRSAIQEKAPAKLRDLHAMLPPVPRRPLRHLLPGTADAKGKPRFRTGFFLGCAQSLLFAGQSAATVRVLQRNGCTVITPGRAVCCGMPAIAYAQLESARRQARHNIELFEKANVEVIIADCATCGATLKDYGALLADDPVWNQRAEDFSHKVRDVTEFLASIPLEKPRGRLEARVTYHDPCHLRRAQKIWRQPRDLLRMIDGLDFAELPEADWCCGSAGSQLLTHYQTSVQVLDRKIQNLQSTGAQVVASGCPACRMQLRVGLRRNGLHMQVMHPVELLDQAYQS